jgi:hypothetical protein
MRLKSKRKFIFLLPLFLGFILYSCVEEPTIAPVGPVFSVVKIANMSNNVDAINVSIGGKQTVSSLGKGETTDYIKTDAGKLDFTVTNSAGEKIYEKTIELIVWERTVIVFGGNYDAGDPLLNTFADFEISEGETYVSSKPPADSLGIRIINASNDVDTVSAKSFDITAKVVPPDTTIADTTIAYSSNTNYTLPLGYGSTYGVGSSAPGKYTFYFIDNNADPVDTVSAGPYNLNVNLNYNLYLYGNPSDLQFALKEVVPPPILPRD